MSNDLSSIMNQLSELEKKILAHIYHYGPDTPWLLARRLLGAAGWKPIVPEDEVERAVQHLVQLGLLQEFRGSLKGRVTSSVKPWLKVKQRNPERRGRGIYYDLLLGLIMILRGIIRSGLVLQQTTDYLGIGSLLYRIFRQLSL